MPLSESEFDGFFDEFGDEATIGDSTIVGMFNWEPVELFNEGQFPIKQNQLSFQSFRSKLAAVNVNDTLMYSGSRYRVMSIEESASNVFVKLFLNKA